MAESRIEGQVAQILTDRELAINKGVSNGVEVGMRFAILNRRGADIKDPETGEILGSIELPKTIVKIVRVYDKLSVGRTFRTVQIPWGPMRFTALEGLTRPPQTKIESLRTSEKHLRDELSEEESSVKIGDLAIQAIGDEFDDQD